MNPQVTVIMPAHNAEPFIAQAIESVLWQTYANFKLWILENGSSDKTLEIARSFADGRITVFELGKVGFPGALEFAIRNAATPWLARMDADDLMFPERLQRQMAVLESRTDLAFVGTHHSLLTPFGHILDRLPFPPSQAVDTERMATQRGFADASVIFSRQAALAAGGTDPEFGIADFALWFRLLASGKGWQTGEPLYLYRLVPTSHSNESGRAEEIWRLKQKYAPHVSQPRAAGKRCTPFWAEVAALELTVGDCQAVRRAAQNLERLGEPREAKLMRWRARMGKLGTLYYRFRNRHLHRHRPDLESKFSTLLGGKTDSQAVGGEGLALIP